jgi:thioredoxin-related protein
MFNECLTNRKYRLLIQQEAKLGQQLFGIRSLPTFVFLDKENGNYIVVPGLYETADVLSAIAYLQESR